MKYYKDRWGIGTGRAEAGYEPFGYHRVACWRCINLVIFHVWWKAK